MKVIIDGVEYVPVMQSSPDMRTVADGLLASFWGDTTKKTPEELAAIMDGVFVYVNDNAEGKPISEVLANVARAVRSAGGGRRE